MIGISWLAAAMTVFALEGAAHAAGAFSRSGGHLGLAYLTYGGSPATSLGGSGTGFGLEATTERMTDFLALLGKARLDYGQGSATFLDAGSESSLSFRSYTAVAGFGVRVNIVPGGDENRLQTYLGAAANIGMTQLLLPTSGLTELSSSNTSLCYGYDLFAGLELAPGKPKRRAWAFFIEAQLRTLQARSLAGQSAFGLGGLTFVAGVAW